MEFFTLFKTQVHLVALTHIKFVCDQHCCVFLGIVGTCFSISSDSLTNSLIMVVLYLSGASQPGYNNWCINMYLVPNFTMTD